MRLTCRIACVSADSSCAIIFDEALARPSMLPSGMDDGAAGGMLGTGQPVGAAGAAGGAGSVHSGTGPRMPGAHMRGGGGGGGSMGGGWPAQFGSTSWQPFGHDGASGAGGVASGPVPGAHTPRGRWVRVV